MRRFEIPVEVYGYITDSASTQELSQSQWPVFINDMPNVRHVAGWRTTEEGVDGVMQVVRDFPESNEHEWKVDHYYTVATTEDGKHWMWGPDKDIYYKGSDGELKHHTNWLNPWDVPG